MPILFEHAEIIEKSLMATILILEDEKALRDMVAFSLERAGYQVLKARDCSSAKALISESLPDLLISDWMLPGQSGIEFVKELRADEVLKELPIIMLTAKSDEDEKVHGLDVGADDYITKPFSKRELLARVKAQLRRSPAKDDSFLSIGELSVNFASHEVTLQNEVLHLGPTEYKFLEYFVTNQNRVFSREQLLNRIWRNNSEVDERTVDVHIRRLRKALAVAGYDKFIHTVRGAGYRFSYSPD